MTYEEDNDNYLQRKQLADELSPLLGHKKAWRTAFLKYPKTIPQFNMPPTNTEARARGVAKARLRLASYREQGREDIVALILEEFQELRDDWTGYDG